MPDPDAYKFSSQVGRTTQTAYEEGKFDGAAEARAAERQRIRQRASDLIDQYENDGEYREPEIRAFVADLLDGDGDD